MNNKGYKFRSIPLVGAAVREIILELYAGKDPVSQKQIREDVLDYHLKNGGKPPEAKLENMISFAVQRLRDKKCAEKVAKGYWRFFPDDPKPSVTEMIGDGSGWVYVYYFPTHRQNAVSKGKSSWECKIGQTDGDPHQRIKDQIGKSPVSFPEEPEIPLLIKTDSPKEVEKAIHGILTALGKYMKKAPGNEWYITSPDEVKNLFEKNFGK